jgi:hypothetical protein
MVALIAVVNSIAVGWRGTNLKSKFSAAADRVLATGT